MGKKPKFSTPAVIRDLVLLLDTSVSALADFPVESFKEVLDADPTGMKKTMGSLPGGALAWEMLRLRLTMAEEVRKASREYLRVLHFFLEEAKKKGGTECL
jgi:hypothetical protein